MRKKRKIYVNYLHELFRAYMKHNGETSTTLSKKLFVAPESVRRRINLPAEKWTIGELKKYCDVMGIPYTEAFNAAMK